MLSMKYKIIVNPVAGKGRAMAFIGQVRNMLLEREVEFEFVLTKAPGNATRLAKKAALEGWEVIVSLGGDGTTSKVIDGLIDSNSILGIIPCGTGNDLVRNLGIPLNIEQAVHTLIYGKRHKIDIGWERDQTFANIASIGFPCEVMRQANAMEKLNGSLAFLSATYKALSSLKAEPARIEMDDEIIETKVVSVTINNMKYAGGGMVFAPNALPDDGLFDICIVREIGKLSFALTFPQMYRNIGAKHPALSRHRSKTVKIFTDGAVDKMFDGDIDGKTPLEAQVLPKAIDVLIPYDKS